MVVAAISARSLSSPDEPEEQAGCRCCSNREGEPYCAELSERHVITAFLEHTARDDVCRRAYRSYVAAKTSADKKPEQKQVQRCAGVRGNLLYQRKCRDEVWNVVYERGKDDG